MPVSFAASGPPASGSRAIIARMPSAAPGLTATAASSDSIAADGCMVSRDVAGMAFSFGSPPGATRTPAAHHPVLPGAAARPARGYPGKVQTLVLLGLLVISLL